MYQYWIALAVYALLLGSFAWNGWRRVHDVPDYVLGGRRLDWFVTALSAGATGMSGWLMLGLPGEVYGAGGEVFWLILGLILGITGNWILVAAPLRTASAASDDALTLPVYLAARAGSTADERWTATPALIRRASGLLVLIFLGLYAATGMVAGGKLFHAVFGMDYAAGVLIVGAVVVLYSLLGGFFSISWSDVLQGLMMVAMLALTAALASAAGGEPSMTASQAADFANPLLAADGSGIGLIAVLSGLSWGLGYFGQPHILARFQAMRSVAVVRRAFPLALSWAVLCMFCAAVIGFNARLTFALEDPESALLEFIELLYNPWIGGIALAALLAAIMSTADSQLLVAGTALTHDLMEGERHRSLRLDRLALGGLAVVAMLLALNPENTIFDLVAYAWAGLGAAFGPAVLLSLHWKRLTGPGTLASVLGGAGLVFLWDWLPPSLTGDLYVLGPAFTLSLLLAVGVSLATRPAPNSQSSACA